VSYRDFLAREIFAPLGLTRASIPERVVETVDAAQRYAQDASPLPFFVTDFPGGSALYASVEDIVRFGSFHAGALMPGARAVLTPASLAAMQQPGPGDYGLGWSVNLTWNRYPIVWHSGAFPGSAAALWTIPAQKVAVAVIANQITAPVNQLAGEVLGALVPGSPPAAQAPVAPKAPIPVPVRAAPAGIQTGRYRGALMACPSPEALTLDVQGPHEMTVTLGAAGPKLASNVVLDEGTLVGTFNGSAGTRDADYRFYLRVSENRLEGPITRRISMSPRANEIVTLWAALDRER
jgi:hypothetical protein